MLSFARSTSTLLFLAAVLPFDIGLFVSGSAAQEQSEDPYLGNPEAIAVGRTIYGSKCYICHHSAGARGPNLFASKLTPEGFMKTVTHGRPNTQMPAFGSRLTPDEIWQLHAFIKSTDHY